jgi:hypothetical protein
MGQYLYFFCGLGEWRFRCNSGIGHAVQAALLLRFFPCRIALDKLAPIWDDFLRLDDAYQMPKNFRKSDLYNIFN